MHRLEDRVFWADISTRCNTEATYQTSTQIARDISVEVREHDDLELRGIHNDVHAERIDDVVIEFNGRMLFSNFTCATQEQAIGMLHDVRLVSSGDLLVALLLSVVERIFDDGA